MTAVADERRYARPVDVERRLLQLEQQLQDSVVVTADLEAAYLPAKVRVERARAEAYLRAEGRNQKDREALATLACGDQLEELAVIEAKLKASKEHARMLYTQVDIARTVGVLARAGMNV